VSLPADFEDDFAIRVDDEICFRRGPESIGEYLHGFPATGVNTRRFYRALHG
jgi:hypothetical protein